MGASYEEMIEKVRETGIESLENAMFDELNTQMRRGHWDEENIPALKKDMLRLKMFFDLLKEDKEQGAQDILSIDALVDEWVFNVTFGDDEDFFFCCENYVGEFK